jgi:hypothetical protein
MIKGYIQQEEIILNIYALNITAPNYIQQIVRDLKRDIDSNIIIVECFNTPLSAMYRSQIVQIESKQRNVS